MNETTKTGKLLQAVHLREKKQAIDGSVSDEVTKQYSEAAGDSHKIYMMVMTDLLATLKDLKNVSEKKINHE